MSERMVSTEGKGNCDVVGHNYVPSTTLASNNDSNINEIESKTSVLRIYCTKCGDVRSIAE